MNYGHLGYTDTITAVLCNVVYTDRAVPGSKCPGATGD